MGDPVQSSTSPKTGSPKAASPKEAADPTDTTHADTAPIAADDYDEGGDGNSAYDSELASYTTSLASGVEDYKFQHGRRYHAYKEGSYVFPNDDKEADRLDIMHQMIKVALNGKLHNAPIKDPKRILDLGTGTGIWAIEIGDEFPNSDVLGNDLSPIQPRWVPPNVHFEVDDVEEAWTYTQKFDLVHCRTLYGSISNWPALIQKCFDATQPGGYSEFTDLDVFMSSPDNSLVEGSAIHFQNREVIRLLEQMGKEPSPGKSLEKWVRNAGFEDVQVRKIPIPIGTWPKDKHLKEIGSWMYLQLYEGAESFTTFLFTTMLNWSKEEVISLAARLRAQMKDPKVHTLMNLYNVVGRKPAEKKEPSPTTAEEELKP